MSRFEQPSDRVTQEHLPPKRAPEESLQAPRSQVGEAFTRVCPILSRVFSLPDVRVLLTAAFLSLTCMTIPALAVSDGVEGAWCLVLSYAHQTGLQFGVDIVYPYGPLGFLILPLFTPQSVLLRLAVDAALSFGVAAAVCLLAWRLEIRWRLLVLVVFAFLASNIEYAAQDLLINLGLLSWGLLCAVEGRPRLNIYVIILVLLAVFSSLAKFSCLIFASLTVAAVSVDLWVRGKRWVSLGITIGFVFGVAGGWMVLGQALANLGTFLGRGLASSKGYAQTMALEPPAAVLVEGLLVAGFAVALTLVRCLGGLERGDKILRWRRILWLTWLLSLLFLAWKHGFLRADSHHNSLFLGFAAVMLLLLLALPCEGVKSRNWSVGLAWTGCILAVLTLQTTLYPQYLHLDRPFSRAAFNVRCLLEPAAYIKRMNLALEQTKRVAALPTLRQVIGPASVDVFGNYQVSAIFSGLNYRPRPIFQSFTAYNASLMRWNETFYSSSKAPDYVLYRIDSIDKRFPPLEDARVFRDLLINYEFKGADLWFLLLKAKPPEPVKLTLLREGAVRSGEPIDLSDVGAADIWLQIEVKPTLAGGLRQFLYQPSPVRLRVSGELSGKQEGDYCAPAPMLAAGFLASPLLTNTAQVVDLFTGKPVIRPKAYSVELPSGTIRMWQPDIRFRIYRIENPLGQRSFPR